MRNKAIRHPPTVNFKVVAVLTENFISRERRHIEMKFQMLTLCLYGCPMQNQADRQALTSADTQFQDGGRLDRK